jgi:hypothetical protein
MLLFAGAGQAFASGTGATNNGVYEVQVLSGGTWRTVASPGFGLGYGVQAVSLGGAFDQVRLVQSGGTAAQLDSVSLDGQAASAVAGSPDALVLAKLRATDSDVVNALGDALTLTFPASGSALRIVGRVQGDISWAMPFEYPVANCYTPVTAASSFYTVTTGDLPSVIDTTAKPFIQVPVKPGTGHPNGDTYVWLAKSDQDLLATIDFTSDNTMDGNDDYAKVHVRTATGVKDFKESVDERTWGVVAFTYTDKVSYQHKLYTFSIPWSEIGTTRGAVDIAFATYGTSALPMPVYRFFDVPAGSHFYTADDAERANVVAKLAPAYVYEGVAWSVNLSDPNNDTPLYRFYNKTDGSHFYTASEAEKNAIVANLPATYLLEGPVYNVCATAVAGATPVYRFYDKVNGSHFYTASEAEKNAVVANLPSIYSLEGIGFYLAP